MNTIDALNELAESTLDSKNTEAGEFLFFKSSSTVGESLKKLQKHYFKIGYAFTIEIKGQEYTRFYAYNQKNDIFRGWIGPVEQEDGSIEQKMPMNKPSFPCYLTMARQLPTGQLKLFREDFKPNASQIGYGNRLFGDLKHITEITDVSWYGIYWPILENKEIEQKRRLSILNNPKKDTTFYCDIATFLNIYHFEETYEQLDDGLKRIYKPLLEGKYEAIKFEMKDILNNREMMEEISANWDIDVTELAEHYPQIQKTSELSAFAKIKSKIPHTTKKAKSAIVTNIFKTW